MLQCREGLLLRHELRNEVNQILDQRKHAIKWFAEMKQSKAKNLIQNIVYWQKRLLETIFLQSSPINDKFQRLTHSLCCWREPKLSFGLNSGKAIVWVAKNMF